MNMKTSKDRKSFVDCFSDFMSDPENFTQDELLSELKDQGIDVTKLEMRVAEIVKKDLRERRLAWLTKARERRLKLKKLLDTLPITKGSQDLKSRFQEILKGSYGQEALRYVESYFRKKGSLSENDLASLIEDLEHLNLLEELNKKED